MIRESPVGYGTCKAAKKYRVQRALLSELNGIAGLATGHLLKHNAALTGAEGFRVEGTVMQHTEDLCASS